MCVRLHTSSGLVGLLPGTYDGGEKGKRETATGWEVKKMEHLVQASWQFLEGSPW